MERRVVPYDEMLTSPTPGNGAGASTAPASTSTPSTPATAVAGQSATGKQPHWRSDGQPISASASRKYKKILELLSLGEIDAAESMLSKPEMKAAKSGVDMQEALAWAKRKRGQSATSPPSQASGSGGPSGQAMQAPIEIGRNAFESVKANGTSAVADKEDDHVEVWQPGTSVEWYAAEGAGSTSKLSHAEIWDDSSLVSAWDAAMEEYDRFAEQRKAHEQDRMDLSGGTGPSTTMASSGPTTPCLKRGTASTSTSPAGLLGQGSNEKGTLTEPLSFHGSPAKKRARLSTTLLNVAGSSAVGRIGALWSSAPDVGSQEAQQARDVALKSQREKQQLEQRKRQAKDLLARVSGAEASNAQQDEVGDGSGSANVSASNAAWQSAVADVAHTPNRIGVPEAENTPSASQDAPHDADAEAAPSSSTTATMTKEEVLQNLAMAWYYAGYYQAMAAQM